MYHHSYNLSIQWGPLGESYNVIFDSYNEIPTIKEFFDAVKKQDDTESKEKILLGKFWYNSHIIFKN